MRRNRRAGYTLITSSLCIVGMLGFLGLAVDAGYLQVMKQRAQVAADAAATGGAHELLAGRTSEITNSALYDAGLNGFTQGVNGVTITVNTPPTSGSYSGDSQAVEAIVSRPLATFFMRFFNVASLSMRARAVARPTSSPTCIWVLDPSAYDAFRASQYANVQLNCGIAVNSSSYHAFNVDYHACLTASAISVVGGASITTDCGTGVQPTPTTGATTFTDPLASVPRPGVGACNFWYYKKEFWQTATINPGVYCGGITIRSHSTLTMNPGLYIINGGPFEISDSTARGSGVTIYHTGEMSGEERIYLTNSDVQLSAPTSGTYTGMLYFQDRLATTLNDSYVLGTSSTKLEGTLYLPSHKLTYSGGSVGVSAYTMIVAKQLYFSGHTYFDNDYSGLATGSPIKQGVVLGE